MSDPAKRNPTAMVLMIVGILILLVFIAYTMRQAYRAGKQRGALITTSAPLLA